MPLPNTPFDLRVLHSGGNTTHYDLVDANSVLLGSKDISELGAVEAGKISFSLLGVADNTDFDIVAVGPGGSTSAGGVTVMVIDVPDAFGGPIEVVDP